PNIAARGFEFSPVPSQTTLEFFGSTFTQQRLNDPPRSNTGVKSRPRFSDFHKPPAAVATQYTFGFFGSTSMSATRPVVSDGPMLRRAKPSKTSAVSRS